MGLNTVIPQLRTTDLDATVVWYTEVLGAALAFRHGDFYAGVEIGAQMVHLKLVDDPEPSIPGVRAEGHAHLIIMCDDVTTLFADLKQRGAEVVLDLASTDWGTLDGYVADDQGHVLALSQTLVEQP